MKASENKYNFANVGNIKIAYSVQNLSYFFPKKKYKE
jgi:hypothetical protein